MKFPEGGSIFTRVVWLRNQAVRVTTRFQNGGGLRSWGKPRRRKLINDLLAELEFLGHGLITAQIGRFQVVKQAAALADHHEQPAARAVIFLVGLQMFGQMVDTLRQQGHLHVGRTGVFGVRFKCFNRLRLSFHNLK